MRVRSGLVCDVKFVKAIVVSPSLGETWWSRGRAAGMTTRGALASETEAAAATLVAPARSLPHAASPQTIPREHPIVILPSSVVFLAHFLLSSASFSVARSLHTRVLPRHVVRSERAKTTLLPPAIRIQYEAADEIPPAVHKQPSPPSPSVACASPLSMPS